MARLHLSRSFAIPPEEVLKSYLAARSIGISLEQAAQVCAATGINDDRTKLIARRLEAQLAKVGIRLKHTHALEAISQMAGYGSYMSSLDKRSGAAPVYALFFSVNGEELEPECYGSIGDAITVLLDTVIRLTPERVEPSVCEMTRLPCGLNLVIPLPQTGRLEVFIACFREDSLKAGSPAPVWMDMDELRAMFRRVVDNIEQARPAIFVNGGAFPQTVAPWCKVWFQISSDQAAPYPQVDELGLFRFFDLNKCDGLQIEDGRINVRGREDTFDIKPCWVNVIPGTETAIYEVEAEDTLRHVWKRYLRYLRQT